MSNDEEMVETANEVDEVKQSKTIILFSDGTGNSSGKLHRTNVWRMYQTVDLGVPQNSRHRVQIGRYDNGVGNSTFRLLAMLQGIFGWGLKRNVLSLYLFLCRNYRDGDSICLFGFSRGAFTVRLLADFIDKQGVIPHKQPVAPDKQGAIPDKRGGALAYLVHDAYRAYRKAERPRMWPMLWLFPLGKWVAAKLRAGWRIVRFQERYDGAKNHKPRIAFLGVWDTVGAHGGPFLEFVRGVDDWIMPIRFKNRKLPRCVETARHALALDDERDSFEPLAWDERNESRKRLQQVWFAGMHSDVGGGYPDDSLSYVSFNWMLDEAKSHADLRFRKDREGEARLQADSLGPIHNSRAGLGGYYRYQPRDISALMWPRAKGTESRADPEQPEDEGLRRPALIHDSVFRRILSGTDGYAPIPVACSFEIVADISAGPPPPRFAEHRKRFLNKGWQTYHEKVQHSVWDGVWKRRIVYFLIVLFSLGLAFSPLFIPGRDGRGSVVSVLMALPPQWLGSLGLTWLDWWLEPFTRWPWVPLALIAIIVALFKVSGVFEKSLRELCRSNWFAPLREPDAEAPDPSRIHSLRIHWFYQDLLGFIRWTLLPAVVGIAILALLVIAFLSFLTVARLTWNEQRDILCPPQPGLRVGLGESFWMSTGSSCTMTTILVENDKRYGVTLVVPEGEQWRWRDGAAWTSPEGIEAGKSSLLQEDRLFTLMRRHPDVQWMRPLIHIRSARPPHPARTEALANWSCDRTRRRCRGDFVAGMDGRLAIAVNEAIAPWPFRHDFFYNGRLIPLGDGWIPRNTGGACVRIVELGRGEELPSVPSGPVTCRGQPREAAAATPAP